MNTPDDARPSPPPAVDTASEQPKLQPIKYRLGGTDYVLYTEAEYTAAQAELASRDARIAELERHLDDQLALEAAAKNADERDQSRANVARLMAALEYIKVTLEPMLGSDLDATYEQRTAELAYCSAKAALAATPAEPAGEMPTSSRFSQRLADNPTLRAKFAEGLKTFRAAGEAAMEAERNPQPAISPATTAGGELPPVDGWTRISPAKDGDYWHTNHGRTPHRVSVRGTDQYSSKFGHEDLATVVLIQGAKWAPAQPEGDAKDGALKLANAISSQAMQTASDIWTAVNDALCEEGPILKESMRDKLAVGLVPVFHRIAAMAKTEEGRG